MYNDRFLSWPCSLRLEHFDSGARLSSGYRWTFISNNHNPMAFRPPAMTGGGFPPNVSKCICTSSVSKPKKTSSLCKTWYPSPKDLSYTARRCEMNRVVQARGGCWSYPVLRRRSCMAANQNAAVFCVCRPPPLNSGLADRLLKM